LRKSKGIITITQGLKDFYAEGYGIDSNKILVVPDAVDSSTSSQFDVLGLCITPSKIPATTLDEYVRAGNKATDDHKTRHRGRRIRGDLRSAQSYKRV